MTSRFLAGCFATFGLIAAAAGAASAQTPVPGTTTVIPSAGAPRAPAATATTGSNVLGPGKDSPGPAGQMGGSGGTAPAGASVGGAPAGGQDTIRTR